MQVGAGGSFAMRFVTGLAANGVIGQISRSNSVDPVNKAVVGVATDASCVAGRIGGGDGVRGVPPFHTLDVERSFGVALDTSAGRVSGRDQPRIAAGDHVIRAGSMAVLALDVRDVLQRFGHGSKVTGYEIGGSYPSQLPHDCIESAVRIGRICVIADRVAAP